MSEFKEIPLKRVGTQIPKCLLPVWSDPLIIGKPEWLLDPPMIEMLKKGCITVNPLCFRDRKGREWYVPQGLPNDGMSYPPIVDQFYDRYDIRTRRPATLHDCHFALNDYYPDWHDKMPLFDININLLDGLRLDRPEVARRDYIFVKIFGYCVWAHKSNEPLMREWLDMIQRSENELNLWIQGVIKAQRT
jgi:hypothetical protein